MRLWSLWRAGGEFLWFLIFKSFLVVMEINFSCQFLFEKLAVFGK